MLESGLGKRLRCLSAATDGLINLLWQTNNSALPLFLCKMSQWVFVTAGSSCENAHSMHVLSMCLSFSGVWSLLWLNRSLTSSKFIRHIRHLIVISCFAWAEPLSPCPSCHFWSLGEIILRCVLCVLCGNCCGCFGSFPSTLNVVRAQIKYQSLCLQGLWVFIFAWSFLLQTYPNPDHEAPAEFPNAVKEKSPKSPSTQSTADRCELTAERMGRLLLEVTDLAGSIRGACSYQVRPT